MPGEAILVFEWMGRIVAIKGYLRNVEIRQSMDSLGLYDRFPYMHQVEAQADLLVTEMVQRTGDFDDAWADAGKGVPYEQPALNPHREELDGN